MSFNKWSIFWKRASRLYKYHGIKAENGRSGWMPEGHHDDRGDEEKNRRPPHREEQPQEIPPGRARAVVEDHEAGKISEDLAHLLRPVLVEKRPGKAHDERQEQQNEHRPQ